MFDDPALAFDQESPDAGGQSLEHGRFGLRQGPVQQVRHGVSGDEWRKRNTYANAIRATGRSHSAGDCTSSWAACTGRILAASA
jgi:hypothetical protein